MMDPYDSRIDSLLNRVDTLLSNDFRYFPWAYLFYSNKGDTLKATVYKERAFKFYNSVNADYPMLFLFERIMKQTFPDFKSRFNKKYDKGNP